MLPESVKNHASETVVFLTLLAGVLVSAVALRIPNPYSYGLSIAFIAGSVVSAVYLWRVDYLLFEYKSTTTSLTKPILIVSLVVFSFLIWQFTPGTPRSIEVHAAQLTLYLFCAIVIFLDGRRSIGLGFLTGTALVHRITVYWASSAPIGLDAQFHLRVSEAITTAGSLGPLRDVKYFYAPLQHLLVSIQSQLGGVEIRMAGLIIVISIVLMGTLGVYAITANALSPSAGLAAAYLFGISEYLTNWAVQITPTTLGSTFAISMFIALLLYWSTRDNRYLVVFLILFGSQTLTHQVSTLASAIIMISFIFGWVLYNGRRNDRYPAITLTLLICILVFLDWITTQRGGPSGDGMPFLVEMLINLYGVIQATDGRPIPPQDALALAGSDALSLLQVLGLVILLVLAVVGAVHCLRDERRRAAHATGLGFVLAAIGIMLFPAPAAGINFFLPDRWYLYFYLPSAIFGGVAIAAAVAYLQTKTTQRTQAIAVVAFVLLLLSPYTALMALGYPGAIDDPVIDDSPGAYRLATTPQEDALYQHTARHGPSATTTVADHVARQLVERRYGHETEYYRVDDATGEPLNNEYLLVDRRYTRTTHTSYMVRTNSLWRVFGPLPVDRHNTHVVYDNGDDELRRSHDD